MNSRANFEKSFLRGENPNHKPKTGISTSHGQKFMPKKTNNCGSGWMQNKKIYINI